MAKERWDEIAENAVLVIKTSTAGFVVPTLFLNVGLSMAEQPVEEERNMAQEALRTSLGVFYGPFGM